MTRLFAAILASAALLDCALVRAQIVRLPSVSSVDHMSPPLDGRPRTMLAGYPAELSQPLTLEGQPSAGPDLPGGTLNPPGMYALPPEYYVPDGMYPAVAPDPEEPPLPKGAKPGVFQQILVTETYLPRLGGDQGFGMNDTLVQLTLGFPFFTRANPLVVMPAFEIQMLDGPTSPSLPPQLYDASIDFLNIRKLTDRFSLLIGASPGAHGDFDKSNDEAFRVPARLLGMWNWGPETQFVFGVLYLARDDINFLPAGGLIWTPDEDCKLELIFPRPRFAQRFVYEGDIEWWWYVAGEFGGGSYAVRDAGGFGSNVVTLSDLRAILGLERRVAYGINSRIEVGYVFNRKIEFQEFLPTFQPDPTLLVRGGLSY